MVCTQFNYDTEISVTSSTCPLVTFTGSIGTDAKIMLASWSTGCSWWCVPFSLFSS